MEVKHYSHDLSYSDVSKLQSNSKVQVPDFHDHNEPKRYKRHLFTEGCFCARKEKTQIAGLCKQIKFSEFVYLLDNYK
jgi:hypothetical protein